LYNSTQLNKAGVIHDTCSNRQSWSIFPALVGTPYFFIELLFVKKIGKIEITLKSVGEKHLSEKKSKS